MIKGMPVAQLEILMSTFKVSEYAETFNFEAVY